MNMEKIKEIEDRKKLKEMRERFALTAPESEVKSIFDCVWRETARSENSVSGTYAKARVIWADALIKELEK